MRRSTVAGTVLGAATAVAVTSESFRKSSFYWWLSDRLATPLLRRIPDAELAHSITIGLLRTRLGPIAPGPANDTNALQIELWNKKFPHPIGLAAGFDKQAVAVEPLLDLGFSFLEVSHREFRPCVLFLRLVQSTACVHECIAEREA